MTNEIYIIKYKGREHVRCLGMGRARVLAASLALRLKVPKSRISIEVIKRDEVKPDKIEVQG